MQTFAFSWLLLGAVLVVPLHRARADATSLPPGFPLQHVESTEPDAEAAEDPRTLGYFAAEPGWLWRRRHGAAVATFGAQLAFVSSSALTGPRDTQAGVQGQVLGAPRGFPLLLGLGFGSLYFERDRRTVRGPWQWTRVEDGLIDSWSYGRTTTTTVRSLQLRHVELLARLQPYWGAVRPYLEGAFGVGILWQGIKVDDEVQEAERSVARLYGATLGVDVQLLPQGRRNGHLLIVSIAVRRLWTDTLTRTSRVASDARAVTREAVHRALSFWAPTVAVGLAF